jgi:ABC-type antimicrobial peptide transport system permease subunit
MIFGIGIASLINPNPFSLKQIYYARIARIHYYDIIETNDRIFVKEFFIKMNNNKDYIYSDGVGDYLKPIIPEQEIIQMKRHRIIYDKKHAEPYTMVNEKGELTQKYKFKPISLELYFNPSIHQKIRESDSIKKVLTPKRNENMQMMFYLLIAIVIIAALFILFGGAHG